jgi:hypothetical protein
MPVTISARLAPETAEHLKRVAEEEDRTLSDIVNRALNEYVRAARFPGIFFVTGASGKRKAKLAAGPDVWSVVFVARAYEMDAEETAEHFRIPVAAVRTALAYYAAHPEEIDSRLRRMEELDDDPQLLHPSVRVIRVSDTNDAAAA